MELKELMKEKQLVWDNSSCQWTSSKLWIIYTYNCKMQYKQTLRVVLKTLKPLEALSAFKEIFQMMEKISVRLDFHCRCRTIWITISRNYAKLGVVACTCNTAAIEAEFRIGVGSILDWGNIYSVEKWISGPPVIQH